MYFTRHATKASLSDDDVRVRRRVASQSQAITVGDAIQVSKRKQTRNISKQMLTKLYSQATSDTWESPYDKSADDDSLVAPTSGRPGQLFRTLTRQRYRC